MPFPRRAIPPLIRVEQKLSREHLPEVRASVRARLLESGCLRSVKNGASIAITAGSRGLGGFRELLAGAIDAVKAAGGEPFIIPPMGSHGGAVAHLDQVAADADGIIVLGRVKTHHEMGTV
jgi:uncharacterized protein (DUF362 family)